MQCVIAARLKAPEVVQAIARRLDGKVHELAAAGVEGRQLRQRGKVRRKQCVRTCREAPIGIDGNPTACMAGVDSLCTR